MVAEGKKQIAKVVAVPSEFQLVINLGVAAGVRVGERYLVYRRGEELFDPDTKESLGHYEMVVGRARVILVNEKNSTLESDEYELIEWERNGPRGLMSVFPSEKRTEKQMKPIDASVGDLAKRA